MFNVHASLQNEHHLYHWRLPIGESMTSFYQCPKIVWHGFFQHHFKSPLSSFDLSNYQWIVAWLMSTSIDYHRPQHGGNPQKPNDMMYQDQVAHDLAKEDVEVSNKQICNIANKFLSSSMFNNGFAWI